MDTYKPLPESINRPELMDPVALYHQGYLASEIFSRAYSFIPDGFKSSGESHSISRFRDVYIAGFYEHFKQFIVETIKFFTSQDLVTYTRVDFLSEKTEWPDNTNWTAEVWLDRRLLSPIYTFYRLKSGEFVCHGTMPFGLGEKEFQTPHTTGRGMGLHMLGHHDAINDDPELAKEGELLVKYCSI